VSGRGNGATICVIGVGSPEGDDCLGWEVAQWLADDTDLRDSCGNHLKVECVTHPGAIADALAGCRHALVVDAVRSGKPAGTLHSMGLESVEDVVPALSSHGLDLITALHLARELEPGLQGMHLYGIEADLPRDGAGLSEPVQQALGPLVRRLRRAVLELCGRTGKQS